MSVLSSGRSPSGRALTEGKRRLQALLLLLAYGQALGCECELVGVAPTLCAPLSLPSRFFLPCLHLVGGGGLSNVAAAPDEEGYASTAVVRDPDDYDLLRCSSSPRSPTGQTREEDEDEESESWTVQETQSVRKRREEDENAVKDFGGDLAVACKDNKQGLKTREWDKNRRFDEQFVSHAQKRELQEEAQIQAAGGGLDSCFVQAKPSVFERDKREWEAVGDDGGDFISGKERKKREEEALMISFGGDLSAMSSRDNTHLRKQSWEREVGDAASTPAHFVPLAERKRREEDAALRSFGGGLDTCVKRESTLEREKREFKLRGKVRRKKRTA